MKVTCRAKIDVDGENLNRIRRQLNEKGDIQTVILEKDLDTDTWSNDADLVSYAKQMFCDRIELEIVRNEKRT